VILLLILLLISFLIWFWSCFYFTLDFVSHFILISFHFKFVSDFDLSLDFDFDLSDFIQNNWKVELTYENWTSHLSSRDSFDSSFLQLSISSQLHHLTSSFLSFKYPQI
jgi:hypothetical protein